MVVRRARVAAAAAAATTHSSHRLKYVVERQTTRNVYLLPVQICSNRYPVEVKKRIHKINFFMLNTPRDNKKWTQRGTIVQYHLCKVETISICKERTKPSRDIETILCIGVLVYDTADATAVAFH